MIADTCNDHQLSIDAYINAHQVRTVLASCIAVQGRTIGLIYLENHIAKVTIQLIFLTSIMEVKKMS